jgi:pentapeptide MXKDX repeat protein
LRDAEVVLRAYGKGGAVGNRTLFRPDGMKKDDAMSKDGMKKHDSMSKDCMKK